MAMQPTPVRIKLDTIHCTDSGEIGSAEPYLWTAFFKIDGDTVIVDNTLTLQGTATVVGTPGNHGDLGPGGVNDGDTITIPSALGEFSTTLTPIPVPSLGTNVSGVLGCVAILLEQDDTPGEAVAKGHDELNSALQSALDGLIPTLNYKHQSPNDDDIKVLTDKVGKQVEDAISDAVSLWDWLKVLGNMDDKIGTAVFYQSQTSLCRALMGGVDLYQPWDDAGRWQLAGHMGAVVEELEITCIHKPAGRDDAHHIDRLGGTFLRRRLAADQYRRDPIHPVGLSVLRAWRRRQPLPGAGRKALDLHPEPDRAVPHHHPRPVESRQPALAADLPRFIELTGAQETGLGPIRAGHGAEPREQIGSSPGCRKFIVKLIRTGTFFAVALTAAACAQVVANKEDMLDGGGIQLPSGRHAAKIWPCAP